eukprot:TRINITY_DN20053_c0_g1_i1.p1 TRINITY_DN20053_c0_g1~~TRINITY_DN20053_c0_g1_i1.p1  ORF type:complete len:210 (-),score=52.34 TRINITY_DN20053_c0_g1_i1:68-697(-)
MEQVSVDILNLLNLDIKDLVNLLLVCNKWNNIFKPYLEKTLTPLQITQRDQFNSLYPTYQQNFIQNQQLRLKFTEIKIINYLSEDYYVDSSSNEHKYVELYFIVWPKDSFEKDLNLIVHYSFDEWKRVLVSKGCFDKRDGQEECWNVWIPLVNEDCLEKLKIKFAAKIEYDPKIKSIGVCSFWDNNGGKDYCFDNLHLLPSKEFTGVYW